MNWIALIDSTHHSPGAAPSRVVAGLSLLERAVRLAAVSGCTHAIVAATDEFIDEVEALAAAIDFDIELLVRQVTDAAVGTVISETASAIEPFLESTDGVLFVRSSTVYDRGLVHAHDSSDGLPEGVGVVTTELDELADLLEVGAQVWPELVDHCDTRPPETLVELVSMADTTTTDTDKWQVRVTDSQSADGAALRLWSDCRKDVDGVVSRHLNRYISLSISRAIAATGIKPNHISIVTFSLGVLAAVFAAMGGFWWFVLAGVTYQLNSIIDGVDGELARVKYEFSLLGEWLDTLSDDTKDVLFYAGLAVGCFKMGDFPIAGFDASAWLWLGGIAVAGKLISMVAYYTWLIANKRGDLLAFEWSFEEEQEEPSALAGALSNLKYLTKNDFIVFLAMLMSFVGLLPYFLFIIAPGQFVVASSVVIQRIQRP
jgi:phosphatidylglycerophosphate synthase